MKNEYTSRNIKTSMAVRRSSQDLKVQKVQQKTKFHLKQNQQQFQDWLKMKSVYRSMIQENPMFKNKKYLRQRFQSMTCIKDLIDEFRIWCSQVRNNSSTRNKKKRRNHKSVINLLQLKKNNYEHTFNSVFFNNDNI